MQAYLYKNYPGGGDRIIVHPKGLPPGWTDSGLSELDSARAVEVAHQELRKLREFHLRRARVVHLRPGTLEFIEAFNVV